MSKKIEGSGGGNKPKSQVNTARNRVRRGGVALKTNRRKLSGRGSKGGKVGAARIRKYGGKIR